MKKLSKLLCCGILASTMAFTMVPSVYAAADDAGNQGGPSEELSKGKAELENLSITATNDNTFEKTSLDDFAVNEGYFINYQDLVEDKLITDTDGNYYHTKFENLSSDVIEMSIGGELGIEPQTVIESKDTGSMRHTGVAIKGLKEGTATVKATIYDISNPEKTKTEIVTITIKAKSETPVVPEEPKDEVSFVGSSDVLNSDTAKQNTIDMINNADSSATINLGIKENLSTVSLPKELLQTAKDKNIPLTVNVEMNGRTNSWIFPVTDTIIDVNLAMNVKPSNDFDGLVLAFNHSGILPSGTTVKTYVGDKFKAGDKVQLSYLNESTNTLEETKEYTVDSEGYVSVLINHCSNYVLEAVKENIEPTPEPTPNPQPEQKQTPTPTPDTSNKPVIKDAGSVNTGVADNAALYTLFSMISGLALVVLRKKMNHI